MLACFSQMWGRTVGEKRSERNGVSFTANGKLSLFSLSQLRGAVPVLTPFPLTVSPSSGAHFNHKVLLRGSIFSSSGDSGLLASARRQYVPSRERVHVVSPVRNFPIFNFYD